MDDGEPERMLIRVFPDYDAGWPVWAWDGLTSPADFPDLSPRLVAELTAWQERWNSNNNRPERYRNGYGPRGSQAELDRLARHLAAELRDVADVETDTWSSKT